VPATTGRTNSHAFETKPTNCKATDTAAHLPTRPCPANPTTNLRLQGAAAALGNLASAQTHPDLAAIVLDSLVITVTDLEAASADPRDPQPLTAINARHRADQPPKN
jgi:hypothetical protein